MKAAVATLLLILLACRGDDTQRRGGQFFPGAPGYPVFNVKSFGAVGDGVADDRPAITTAMNAACSSTTPAIVFFPAGTYIVSRDGTHFYSLNIPCSNIAFRGVPYKSTIKHPTGMPNAPVTIIQITSQNHVTIEDLIIDGNWQNAVGYVSAASNGAVLPQATINLYDASFFPSGGGPFTVLTRNDTQAYITCTGKTATTLTGCSGGSGTLYVGMTIGYVDAPAGINLATQTTAGTTIAVASNGATLPQATINVAATTGFVNGIANIDIQTSQGYQLVLCTGTTSTTLTGCTGGTGTMSTGGEVFANGATQGRNPGIGLASATEIDIRNVLIQRIYGDCIGMGGGADPSSNIRITRVDCNIASRDGIAFSSSARGVIIDSFRAFSVAAQAIDAEPFAWPLRDIVIKDSYVKGWWNIVTHGSAPLTIGGASSGSEILSTDARNWRVTNSTFEGAVIIGNASDIVFDNNRVIQNYSNDDISPIWLSGWTQDVTISHNTIYTRAATSGTEGQSDCCAILATSFIYGGGAVATSTNLHITDNKVHARNGRFGIVLVGVGQNVLNTSGTATSTGTTTINSITYTTLTDSGASWTTNQWIGAVVKMGGVQATVLQNTGTVLTLNHVQSVNTDNSAWFTSDVNDRTDVPALGAYKITFPTGGADVSGNIVDAVDDGYGKGKYCYVVGSGNSNAVTTRVRMHHNIARDCDTNAFLLHSQLTNPFPYVEIADNFAYDDQGTPTTTNALGFTNALNVTKLILRNNQKGEGVTNIFSGISAGTWLVNDGIVQNWAGYGAPESVVTAPIGSTYQRVDGSNATASYVKGTGTGNTGWLSAGAAVTTAGTNLSLSSQTLSTIANPTFATSVTVGTQTCSSVAPSVNHGSLGTGSTNCLGNVTSIGAFTSVVLTFGSSAYPARSWCTAQANSTSVAIENIITASGAGTNTFSCYSIATGLAANCDDFTYQCQGQ